ncbi:ABC transporter permease subunit [Salinigranum halophilum]|uniref:ABC transporter permease subunit n=1 Tax=Salinigranum halophilum TaxID=2565931 RepID=UPI00115D96B6|nr:urea ABC transporter permease [Salinigranum halophilum]
MSTERVGGSGPSAEGHRTRLQRWLEGPNTVGRSREFWAGFAVVLAALLAYPFVAGSYQASRFSLFLVYAFLGLSLSVVWGYAGILSFGQVVFFGVAGYTFAVVSINVATPLGITVAFLAGIAGGALMAAVLGYFMFYGGVRNVYVTIITLVSTLVLHTFMAQTAGDEWTIGEAALGGFNGMPTIPNLALGVGPAAVTFDSVSFYYLVLALLVVTYLGLRALVNSDYGRVMVAVREDEDRTEMFGYDVRRVKLSVFTIGGALAGLSGVLYASWGNYVSPQVFELAFASLPVIWVSVGGRKTLLGAVVATVGIEFVRNSLGGEWAFVAVGTLLLVFILGLPGGLVPWIHDAYVDYRGDTPTQNLSDRSVGGD